MLLRSSGEWRDNGGISHAFWVALFARGVCYERKIVEINCNYVTEKDGSLSEWAAGICCDLRTTLDKALGNTTHSWYVSVGCVCFNLLPTPISLPQHR